MRVMYIEKLLDTAINGDTALPSMQIGDEFEVVGEYQHGGRVYYFLAEFPNNMVFRSTSFVTLPDQTADEMKEEKQEAIVNLETLNY